MLPSWLKESQIKGFFSRFKRASGTAKTASVSVAAIESVVLDGDEEDAMLEAIQGLGTLSITR